MSALSDLTDDELRLELQRRADEKAKERENVLLASIPSACVSARAEAFTLYVTGPDGSEVGFDVAEIRAYPKVAGYLYIIMHRFKKHLTMCSNLYRRQPSHE